MRYLPLALALGSAAMAGQAHASEPATAPIILDETKSKPAGVNFRLVPDRRRGAASVGQSGMIASTRVAPNATLGLGLAPKRTTDWRAGAREGRSRKPSVNFQLKF